MSKNPTRLLGYVLLTVTALLPLERVLSFAFTGAQADRLDAVTHPGNYDGTGGVLTVRVGILASSPNAADMVTPTRNVVAVWNALLATTGNVNRGILPSGQFDFESVLLHEVGHSLGLAHCNAASESGLGGSDRDYTKATEGPNGNFDLNPGADGIIGSADDLRGDDINLNFFPTATNNPFVLVAPVDQSTYSMDIAQLPAGDTYSANADRDVGAALGFPNTEAVLQQGTFSRELQRTLTADDVAGIRYAAAGLDEVAGTADDYTVVLNYVGLVASGADADITIQFNDSRVGFAASSSSVNLLANNHRSIFNNDIFFNDRWNWFYNSAPVPVTLVDFAAAPARGGGVDVRWSTAAEYDHAHFELLRSRDLKEWTELGRVHRAARETKASLKEYVFADETAEVGGYYYLLRAVATDGSHEDTEAVYVNLRATELKVVLVGNPLTEASCAEVQLARDGRVDVTVVDASGRTVAAWGVEAAAGVLPLATDRLLRLPAGTYFLQVRQGREVVVERFVR